MSRLVFVVLTSLTITVSAQQAARTFDVVAIKRNVSGEQGSFMAVQPGGRFTVTNMPVRQIIVRAFGLQPFQITGGPDWLQGEKYNIQAKAPDGAAMSGDAINAVLQAMLADRFKLKVRRETRESPIYELVAARPDRRLGAKLRQTSASCSADLARGTPPAAPAALPGPDDPVPCGVNLIGGNRLSAGGQPMARLAYILGPRLQRIVVDRTALTGLYDFDLQFTPDPLTAGSPVDGPVRMYMVGAQVPPLMTAIQEQLGLKLQAARRPVDYVVIESVEKPTED